MAGYYSQCRDRSCLSLDWHRPSLVEPDDPPLLVLVAAEAIGTDTPRSIKTTTEATEGRRTTLPNISNSLPWLSPLSGRTLALSWLSTRVVSPRTVSMTCTLCADCVHSYTYGRLSRLVCAGIPWSRITGMEMLLYEFVWRDASVKAPG